MNKNEIAEVLRQAAVAIAQTPTNEMASGVSNGLSVCCAELSRAMRAQNKDVQRINMSQAAKALIEALTAA
jgi:hypothetical protein